MQDSCGCIAVSGGLEVASKKNHDSHKSQNLYNYLLYVIVINNKINILITLLLILLGTVLIKGGKVSF